MTMLKRKAMNIAAEMHYELNASDFARDFHDATEGREDYNAHSRIGMYVDIDH